MRWLMLLLSALLLLCPSVQAAEGHVLKVLPQFLDKRGRTALTPSLYDRDAYQAILRKDPSKRSTLQFAVQWKARTPETEPLKLRVELVGIAQTNAPKQTAIELQVRQHHSFSHWAYLVMSGEQYKAFGEVTAWRVTLWDGDQLLSEQKSFLWR
ncbi:MAG: hypothetical protein JWQ04_1743 [Pedosphaera sp.]|nr:hypothetical protein [Pedosphaera sp.]